MMFDPKKLFDAAYKKNKLLTCFVCCFSIVSLAHITVTSFYINQKKIEGIYKVIVTRPSFNAYIKRKDTEYHEQSEFNNAMSSKVGHIEGEISILAREREAYE